MSENFTTGRMRECEISADVRKLPPVALDTLSGTVAQWFLSESVKISVALKDSSAAVDLSEFSEYKLHIKACDSGGRPRGDGFFEAEVAASIESNKLVFAFNPEDCAFTRGIKWLAVSAKRANGGYMVMHAGRALIHDDGTEGVVDADTMRALRSEIGGYAARAEEAAQNAQRIADQLGVTLGDIKETAAQIVAEVTKEAREIETSVKADAAELRGIFAQITGPMNTQRIFMRIEETGQHVELCARLTSAGKPTMSPKLADPPPGAAIVSKIILPLENSEGYAQFTAGLTSAGKPTLKPEALP